MEKSKSETQVVKTELLPHDSTSIIGPGTLNSECKGYFPGERKPWTDFSIEDAREHVLGGGSIFISGLPGVAKSYTCVDWVQILKERRRVILTAPTHVATRNMRCEGVESITVQRLYNRYLKYGTFDAATTLVIDEISQVNTSIQYVHEVYYLYDAKRATDALSTGRGQLKGATGTDWMRDLYIHDS